MVRIVATLTFALLASAALAEPKCTTEPKSKWLSETAMKAKIAERGYKYTVFKVTTGNCYEIYGRDSAGKRIEVYFHPMTGEVVKEFKS